MSGIKGTLCLLDASGFVFRAYHALPPLSNSQGLATGAVYGYVTMLLKSMRELSPEFMAVALDSIGRTFREEFFPDYKGHRPEVPPDLKEQFPFIEPVTEALGLRTVRVEGFEADDIIATLAKQGVEKGVRVVVVSGDKDLSQLIRPGVEMYDPMKERWWTPEFVKEKYGVPPEKMGDLLALTGDSSDNIPGVRGIGPKGAAKLLEQFGDLAGVLANADKVPGKKMANALIEQREAALLSRKLVTLRDDVPLGVGLEEFRPRERDVKKLSELFSLLEFKSLLRELLPGSGDLQPEGGRAAVSHGGEGLSFTASGSLERVAPVDAAGRSKRGAESPVLPFQPAGERSPAVGFGPMPEVRVIFSEADLTALAEEIERVGMVSLDTETTSTKPMEAALVGISLSTGPDAVYYIPVAHKGLNANKQLPLGLVREKLGGLIGSESIRKLGQNFKYDSVVLRNHEFPVAGLEFDTMLAAYLLDPGRKSHSLDSLAADFLGIKTITYKEVTGSGAKQVTFDQVPISEAARYSGEDAWVVVLLAEKLRPKLHAEGLDQLLHEVEVPLSDMLAEMEQAGVSVDQARLKELSRDFEARLASLEKEIHAAAGIVFNLNSPIQLRNVLFRRLNLPSKKRTKTGLSTDVSVLEELAHMHAVPRLMLEHRSLSKLKSTYADVLPRLVNRKTGRIHTSFNQAATATGRLSSSDPNLQNIPVRTEDGRRIREAFIPGPGLVFLSADYSQIELRVMAHLARDPALSEAFRRGEDIHTRTAAELFQVPPEMVTPEMRRVAKTINFGIIYGMSAFRLGREQGLPVRQAQEFINRYFERYSGVRKFIEAMVKEGVETGRVRTLLNRHRYLPELRSRNRQVRESGERMAVNTPVQGGAADIMKLAMLSLRRRIREEKLDMTVLLQVHDELILEVPPASADAMAREVKRTMEGAFKLEVPLKVDVGIGSNWAEAH